MSMVLMGIDLNCFLVKRKCWQVCCRGFRLMRIRMDYNKCVVLSNWLKGYFCQFWKIRHLEEGIVSCNFKSIYFSLIFLDSWWDNILKNRDCWMRIQEQGLIVIFLDNEEDWIFLSQAYYRRII